MKLDLTKIKEDVPMRQTITLQATGEHRKAEAGEWGRIGHDYCYFTPSTLSLLECDIFRVISDQEEPER